MALQIHRLSNIGAEVSGFDINEPMTDELKVELRSLWYDHGVLLFRNQDITPEKQIEFSRIFGPLESHPLAAATSNEYPELFVLENGGDKDRFFTANYKGKEIVGRLDWHIDLHYTGRPNHGALCIAQRVRALD